MTKKSDNYNICKNYDYTKFCNCGMVSNEKGLCKILILSSETFIHINWGLRVFAYY